MTETIVVDGITFYRYPESNRRADRLYYTARVAGKTKRLHVYLWEKKHGPVPHGFHIHHENGDSSDNRDSNLVATRSTVHKSDHAKGDWNKERETVSKVCKQCGKTYQAHGRMAKKSQFCSHTCLSNYRYQNSPAVREMAHYRYKERKANT